MEEVSDLNSDNTKTLLVLCPAGKQALGGGAQLSAPPQVAIQETDFYMDNAGNRIGWVARAEEVYNTNLPWVLVAHALCAEA